MMAIGLYLVRWRRNKANLPRPQFKVWHPVAIFNILVHTYLLVMPWYPPAGGKGDVSFWYGTYVVVGISILVLCGIYYLVWIRVLPHVLGYEVRQELVQLDGGVQAHNLVKVPAGRLMEWDAVHDATGRIIDTQGVRIHPEAEKFSAGIVTSPAAV